MSANIGNGLTTQGEGNTLDTNRLPSVERPPFYHGAPLELPSEILESGPSKSTRSALHRIVHAFRKAQGFIPKDGYTDDYLKAVEKFQSIPENCPEAEAIRKLSDPEVYASYRQAQRMRMSMQRLDDKKLALLTREIRAALVWRASFPV
ncbi:MAG: hypothetical protein D6719_12390 [Candidatus Dadabacteria bacterium]|nr:MAG: hypothetical protein D6719_12390 [Candidatus Dadabacteria bacterium]